MFAANQSMRDRFFYDADGELVIVPQLGRLTLHTELGILDVQPGEICLVPRGVKFRVELPDGIGARLHLRELRSAPAAAGSRADRDVRSRQRPRLPGAGGGLRGS